MREQLQAEFEKLTTEQQELQQRTAETQLKRSYLEYLLTAYAPRPAPAPTQDRRAKMAERARQRRAALKNAQRRDTPPSVAAPNQNNTSAPTPSVTH